MEKVFHVEHFFCILFGCFKNYSYLCSRFKRLNMDIDSVTQLVSNVGFPVAVCIALFFYMEKQNERHQQETDKLNETVQSNTKVLTELCTLIKTLIK